MKKVISFAICFSFLSTNFVFALDCIEDNLVNLLDKNLKVEKIKQPLLEDELANKYLNKNQKVVKVKYEPIYDDFANKTLSKNLKVEKLPQQKIVDELVVKIPKDKVVSVGKSKTSIIYDYKAKVYPLVYYTTKDRMSEGEYIDFALAQDVKINNKLYKKSTPIKARIENVSMNSAYGVPADLVVGNFTLPDKTILNGEISIKGANRTLWVYPTGYILTMFFFIGLPIFAVRGGHAKLKPSKIYEVEI